MQGIGPGTTLGGRYTVRERVAQEHDAERWSGRDSALLRDVAVTVLPADHPHVPALLDAARRVAGLDNHRIVRVLDVGQNDRIAYVIEEDHEGTRTLADLVAQDTLPPEEVRRLAGEISSGLEAAAQRGLHHLELRPESVLTYPDGRVKIDGVATDSALSGRDAEDLPAGEASRLDAVGIAGVVYAGLTGRWPLPGQTALGAAPTMVGGVAAPSELVPGVPGDLDALCRLTLNDDQGPITPGDFAAQIAPWSSTPVHEAGDPRRGPDERDARLEAAGAGPAAGATGAATVSAAPDGYGDGTDESDPTQQPEEDVDVYDLRRRRGDRIRNRLWPGPPRESRHDDVDTDTSAAVEEQTDPPTVDHGSAAVVSPTLTMDDDPEAAAPTVQPEHDEPGGTDEQDEHTGSGRGAAVGAAAAGAVARGVERGATSAADAVGRSASQMGETVGTFARAARTKAAERRREMAERRRLEAERRVTLDSVEHQALHDRPIEPPVPLMPATEVDRVSPADSRKALGIVAGGLLLAALLGGWGVSRIGHGTHLDLDAASGGTAGSTPRTTSTEGASVSPGGALKLVASRGYDPLGDGAEHNEEAALVRDGDPKTTWESEGYQDPTFSGTKTGVGVFASFGRDDVEPKSMTLVLPTAATVEVYQNTTLNREGATLLGKVDNREGTITMPITAKGHGRYVIVWFTRISQSDDGRYRAALSEMSFRG